MDGLELGEQQIERVTCDDVGHLRQHHEIEVRARRGDHLDDVRVRPRRRPVVDPDTAQLAGPTRLGEGRRNPSARLRLGIRCDGVLQIEEHLVGGQLLGLLNHLVATAWNRKARSTGAIQVVHVFTLYPLRHGGGQQGLRGPTRGDGGARSRRRVHRSCPRRGDQHQQRPPTAARAGPGRRIAHSQKDFRTDPARHGDRAERGDADHRQRVAAQVRAAPRRGAGARPGPRHPGPRQRSRAANTWRASTWSSPIWRIEQVRSRDWMVTRIAVRSHRRLGRRTTVHVVDWQNVAGLTPSALALPGQGVAQLLAAVRGATPHRGGRRHSRAARQAALRGGQRTRRRTAGRHPAGAARRASRPSSSNSSTPSAPPTCSRRWIPTTPPTCSANSVRSRAEVAAGPDGPRGLRAGAPTAQALPRHRGRPDDLGAGGAGPGHHGRRGTGPGARSRPDPGAGVAGRSWCGRRRPPRPAATWAACTCSGCLREPPAALVSGIVDSDLPNLTPDTSLAARDPVLRRLQPGVRAGGRRGEPPAWRRHRRRRARSSAAARLASQRRRTRAARR